MPCCACHIPHEEIHSTLQDWSCTGTIAMLFRNQHNFEGEGKTTSPDTNHFQTPMPPASQLIDSWHIDDVMGTYPPCFAKCPAQHFQNVDHMHFRNSKEIRTHDPSTHRPISTFPSPSSALGLPSAKASIFFSRTIILSYNLPICHKFQVFWRISQLYSSTTFLQIQNDASYHCIDLLWQTAMDSNCLYLPAPRHQWKVEVLATTITQDAPVVFDGGLKLSHLAHGQEMRQLVSWIGKADHTFSDNCATSGWSAFWAQDRSTVSCTWYIQDGYTKKKFLCGRILECK